MSSVTSRSARKLAEMPEGLIRRVDALTSSLYFHKEVDADVEMVRYEGGLSKKLATSALPREKRVSELGVEYGGRVVSREHFPIRFHKIEQTITPKELYKDARNQLGIEEVDRDTGERVTFTARTHLRVVKKPIQDSVRSLAKYLEDQDHLYFTEDSRLNEYNTVQGFFAEFPRGLVVDPTSLAKRYAMENGIILKWNDPLFRWHRQTVMTHSIRTEDYTHLKMLALIPKIQKLFARPWEHISELTPYNLDSGRAKFYTIKIDNRRRVLPVRIWSKY